MGVARGRFSDGHCSWLTLRRGEVEAVSLMGFKGRGLFAGHWKLISQRALAETDSSTGLEGRNDSSAPGGLEAAPTPNASLQVRRWQASRDPHEVCLSRNYPECTQVAGRASGVTCEAMLGHADGDGWLLALPALRTKGGLPLSAFYSEAKPVNCRRNGA